VDIVWLHDYHQRRIKPTTTFHDTLLTGLWCDRGIGDFQFFHKSPDVLVHKRCFFAAASLEFDSRPGRVRDDISVLTKSWMDALRKEISCAKAQREIALAMDPAQLAFELHAYVQEANWAYKLFADRKAFSRARRAIADKIRSASRPAMGPNSNRKEPNHERTLIR
jgi:hypothetical protein